MTIRRILLMSALVFSIVPMIQAGKIYQQVETSVVMPGCDTYVGEPPKNLRKRRSKSKCVPRDKHCDGKKIKTPKKKKQSTVTQYLMRIPALFGGLAISS